MGSTLGFQMDADRNVKLTNSCQKLAKREQPMQSSTYLSFQWNLRANMFISAVINTVCVVVWPNIYGHDFDIEHLDNRHNAEMNDFLSIDFAKRDWLEDHDMVLVRTTQEFPRLSLGYIKRSYAGDNVPWGKTEYPIQTLIDNDECLIKLNNIKDAATCEQNAAN